MAYNEETAFRIKEHLRSMGADLQEKKMFGGVAFLYKGKMTVGVNKDDLMVRVIEEKMQEELSKDHVDEMKFTGKPMKEFVTVGIQGFQSEQQLSHWVSLGIEHAQWKLGEITSEE